MKPNSAIGFTAILNKTENTNARAQLAITRAVQHFDDIKKLDLKFGNTTLTLWGRDQLDDCYTQLPDGSTLLLIGSPSGSAKLSDLTDQILGVSDPAKFELPWDGRVILLKIDPQNDSWTLWNDWVGSIPVFHAPTPNGRIASTLEPAIVDQCGFGAEDVYSPGLLALLLWGHYFSDWTLFKDMKVVPADCTATWDASGFRATQLFTITPSEDRWQSGWDDMIDEMYHLSKAAIQKSLGDQDQWLLPLSSGLDSRLIAGVASELGADVRAYTWGVPKTSDVIHAKTIAQKLDIPWQCIEPGNTYLTDYRDTWSDLFGSAMHFHGMYQMPFLDALRTVSGTISSGFIGECLTGYDTKLLWETHTSKVPYQITTDGYLHWQLNELRALMNDPIDEPLHEIATAVDELRESIPGAAFQQLKYLVLWGRQRHFTYFQSLMSDYWKGVSTPYLNRGYARFSLALPKVVIDDRVLQQAMLARYYPTLAAIPGTYARQPALLTGSYLLKQRIANYLPDSVAQSVFPGLYRTKPNSDVDCVRHDHKKAFYPLFEKLDHLENWMNRETIEETYQQIVTQSDSRAIRKLQSIQTLAFRIGSNEQREFTK
jgi:hypothetical protein